MSFEFSPPMIRSATPADLDAIGRIDNEGIADRLATLDEHPKTNADILDWWSVHAGPCALLVAQDVTWGASLDAYSQRHAYRDIAEFSIYFKRARCARPGLEPRCWANSNAERWRTILQNRLVHFFR